MVGNGTGWSPNRTDVPGGDQRYGRTRTTGLFRAPRLRGEHRRCIGSTPTSRAPARRALEAPHSRMDMEFRDDRRRGRIIIALGLVLAIVAGGAAFYLVNQANQQAGQKDLQKVSVVVALHEIPARQAIVAEDVAVRE